MAAIRKAKLHLSPAEDRVVTPLRRHVRHGRCICARAFHFFSSLAPYPFLSSFFLTFERSNVTETVARNSRFRGFRITKEDEWVFGGKLIHRDRFLALRSPTFFSPVKKKKFQFATYRSYPLEPGGGVPITETFARYQERGEACNIVRTSTYKTRTSVRKSGKHGFSACGDENLFLTLSVSLFAIDQSERNRMHNGTCSSQANASRGILTYDTIRRENWKPTLAIETRDANPRQERCD